MEKIKKILVATDYSWYAAHAERYALKMAQKFGFEILFVHIYKRPEPSFEESKSSYASNQLRVLKYRVHKLREELHIPKDAIKIGTRVGESKSIEGILIIAKETIPDIIFVGRKGQNAYNKHSLGSIVWDLIQKSPVPVFIIPENSSYINIERIVMPTDYRTAELPVIKFVSEIASLFDAALNIVHIIDKKTNTELEYVAFEEFQTILAKQYIISKNMHFDLLPAAGIKKGITNYIYNSKADLVVITHKKRSLIEKLYDLGVAKRLVFSTRVPLLAIPENYDPDKAGFWRRFTLSERDLAKELHL